MRAQAENGIFDECRTAPALGGKADRSGDAALAFDADAVSEVVFRGFWDEEGEAARAALRRYREAVLDLRVQFREFMDTLTPERIIEYRNDYYFDQMDDEPEPDFPDEGDLA